MSVAPFLISVDRFTPYDNEQASILVDSLIASLSEKTPMKRKIVYDKPQDPSTWKPGLKLVQPSSGQPSSAQWFWLGSSASSTS